MSGFTITIVVGQDKASSSVRVDGSVEHLITDEERLTFGLSETNLKQAVIKYHNLEGGRSPKGVYLRDPTPKHGELYKEHGWSQWQTQTILVASSAEILEIKWNEVSEPRSSYSNECSTGTPTTHKLTLKHPEKNEVEVTWKKRYVGALSVEEEVKYDIGSLGSWGGGEPTLSYTSAWGEDDSKSEEVIIGTISPVTVSSPPNSKIFADTFGIQTIMKVRIRYTASLKSGSGVVMYYKKGYQGHQVWRSPLQQVMAVSGIPNSLETIQDIKIVYYTGDRIEVRDDKTQELLCTHYRPESVPG